jgi:CRISPR-associated protein Cas2
MARSLYLVAYDISDDRLRRRMLRVVRGYASRGQKSALECWLSPTEARELLSKAR